MLVKKIPFYYMIIAAILGGAITYTVFELSMKIDAANASTTDSKNNIANTGASSCKSTTIRLKGYNYINPVLYTEKDCESEDLDPLKQSINDYIASEKAKGTLTTASVCIRIPGKAQWTSINPDEMYHPASLNKVPILITYLHMAENYNNLLNEKLFYDKHTSDLPVQYYTSKQLEPGKSYTIKELLHAMIAWSDNDATLLLLKHINLDFYNKTFTDLGLDKPSFEFEKFLMSARQYTLFFRVLYNGTYLSDAVSEFGTAMLAECDFKKGLLKKLPEGTKAAHKFGEAGYGNVYELHESGIIYAGKSPYIITIMTKGKNWDELSEIIANISSIVYNKLATNV